MYEIRTEKRFRSAYKRIRHSGRFDEKTFKIVVNYLKDGVTLPPKYNDHALKGNLSAHRECHLESDVLLQYEVDGLEKVITLNNIGNHAQLFE